MKFPKKKDDSNEEDKVVFHKDYMANKEKSDFSNINQKGNNFSNNNQGLRNFTQDEIKIPRFLLDEERTEKRTAN